MNIQQTSSKFLLLFIAFQNFVFIPQLSNALLGPCLVKHSINVISVGLLNKNTLYFRKREPFRAKSPSVLKGSLSPLFSSSDGDPDNVGFNIDDFEEADQPQDDLGSKMQRQYATLSPNQNVEKTLGVDISTLQIPPTRKLSENKLARSTNQHQMPLKKSPTQKKQHFPSKIWKSHIPIVSIVGRPNVGKSRIANRISEQNDRGAIVHDEVGVTRDRCYLRSEWEGKVFDVVDTGGLVFDDDKDMLFVGEIQQQADIALSESCAVIFVVDGQAGLQKQDLAVASFLRSEWVRKIPVIVAVNKCEEKFTAASQSFPFYKLGLGQPYPVSGIHGTGLAEMLDPIMDHIKLVTPELLKEEEIKGEACVKVALVGRPNVGKSSLFNRLLGEDRSIVSEISGTTRDTLDMQLERGGNLYKFIDTAGIRKRGKIQLGSESLMVNRALKAIRRADVVLLIIDAILGVSYQDRILADRIAAEGRACVVILNKWDAVEEKDDKTYIQSIEYLRSNLPSIRWSRVILLSALTGQRCSHIFESVDEAVRNHRARVSTAALNMVVKDALEWQSPAQVHHQKSSPKIYYANQISHSPPTVVFFVNKPDYFSDNYKTYLERKIRESLHFDGTPLRFLWRGKKNRAVAQEKKRGRATDSDIKVRKGRFRGDVDSTS